MRNLYATSLIPVILGCLLSTLIACGGGGTTNPPDFTPDPGDEPGIQGDIITPAPGDLPQLQTPGGVSEGAPLGTNEDFNGSAAASEIESFTPLTAEEIEAEYLADRQFDFLWSAITNDGGNPDPKVLPDSVMPGTKINLWVQYYAAAGASLQIHWQMPSVGLNYIGEAIAHSEAGKYLTKFDYYIPYGSLGGPADLAVDIIDAKGVSIGIVFTPDSGPDPEGTPVGLLCGHFDVDTTSYISPIIDEGTKGSTDGHVHEYDDAYTVIGIDAFNYFSEKLHNITEDVPADAKFKLIVANADLSPGGRLVINEEYYANTSDSWDDVTVYDDIALADLPVYSLDGAAGTTQLTQLGAYFDIDAIANNELHPTNTGDVKKNRLGPFGEWRNGALTIQAVEVNSDGTDAFTTDLGLSNGGIQGVADSGLLWETTLFWHWGGPSYHESGWDTYDPTGDNGCGTVVVVDPPPPPTPTEYPKAGAANHAQMAWEDLIVNSDYDYNDMVISMHTEELRNADKSMVQLNLNIKALARGAGYDHEWQFNMDASMPGAIAYAIINQYYADGTPHGGQRIWTSDDGISIPIFVSSKQALPPPPGKWATNVFNNQPFVDGDYCDVSVIFDPPVAEGSYTPAPYAPQMLVKPRSDGSGTYMIGLWTKVGDPVDSNGRPLGFIIPDTYAWPLEREKLWDVYPGFNDWVDWINDQGLTEPSPPWWDGTPTPGKHFNLHLQ